ncbi:MAG TPA: sugar transferase [Stellaceae bacterium]|nr:sugar transferase [Stellaceae bacterium]
MKRISDLVIACALIAFTLPLMAIIALAIEIDSRGPVVVGENRRTADGRPMRVLKFRIATPLRPQSTGTRPGRVTAIGRFLHYTRLVDLPQLVNVLRGEMSLFDRGSARPDFLD